jgi:hypothetical protein
MSARARRTNDHEEVEGLRKAAIQGDLKAITQLGTRYRFGHGVKQDIVTADLHVVAALDGDAVSTRQLADYREEIERAAQSGSLVAALCLAKMFDRGLGVERDRARMFAWLLWGEKRGKFDREEDYAEELMDMKSFFAMILSDADRAKGERVFQNMLGATPERPTSAPGRIL